MKESLIVNNWVLFDENCYKVVDSEEEANSGLRYYSKHVNTFYNELVIALGWSHEEAMELIDLLWSRIIKHCSQYRIPLTAEAEVAKSRLEGE